MITASTASASGASSLQNERIHFMYDAKKTDDAQFARQLISGLGQCKIKDASTVISVGGDGLLLRALRAGINKKVLGLVSPQSNSRGFWTNRDIVSVEDVIGILQNANSYPIHPLRADICFDDKTCETRFGYNDIVIRPTLQALAPNLRKEFGLSANDLSMQSVLLNLRILFSEATLGSRRLMGGGLIFSTALGSTAANSNYGGPAVDIRQDSIVVTGIGISEPHKGFDPTVNAGNTRFEVEFPSQNKRPVVVTFDSFAVDRSVEGSPIHSVRISTAYDRVSHLVLKDDPGRRAYASMNVK